MSYNVYLSNSFIWWDSETENKPHYNYDYPNDWELIENLKPSFLSQWKSEINIPSEKNFTYVKIEKLVNNVVVKTLFYFKEELKMESSVLNKWLLDLDIYQSYTKPFLLENKEKKFNITRAHNFTNNYWLYSDPLINSLPINIKNDTIVNVPYSFFESEQRYYYDGNRSYIKDNGNLRNGNYYYVFKSFDNEDEFWIFPIFLPEAVQTEGGITLYNDTPIYETQLTGPNSTPAFAQRQLDAIRDIYPQSNLYNNKTRIFFTYTFSTGNHHKVTFTDNYPASTDPIAYTYETRYTGSPQAIDDIVTVVKRYGAIVFTDYFYMGGIEQPERSVSFEWTIYRLIGEELRVFTLSNNKKTIEQILTTQGNLQRFVGIYFLPNFLSFTNSKIYTLITSNILYFKLPNNGMQLFLRMPNFQITDGFKKSSTIGTNHYFLKLINLKYFNNLINLNEYLSTEQENDRFLNINGLLTFSNNGNILLYNNYQFTDNSIIELPSQLPSAVDSYSQYVGSIQSQTNTGLQHAKQNLIMQQVNNAFGVASGGLSVGSIGSGIMNAVGSGISYMQKKQSIAASFEDARRVNTVTFATTNIVDVSYMLTHLNTGNFSEVFEFNELEPETIGLINDMFYYYGIFAPIKTSVAALETERIKFKLDFMYIEFNPYFLNQSIYGLNNYWKTINETIVKQLSSGIRLWTKTPD